MDGKIEKREITTELQESYLDYAMSVIVSRALPDVRDGMKPVQRRILWAMWETGLKAGTKLRKSAAVVGEVMKSYHPHGDSSIYDAITRMVQDFSLRYPLIEGQGNWGCFTKDTKVKLTDGRNLNFEELCKEHEQRKKNYTFTINSLGLISIAEIKNPRLTRENAELVVVTLDNGEKIRCTPNHLFMMKDGSYQEAQHLQSRDSLMPIYQKLSNKEDRINREGYALIYQNKKDEWVPAHHLADNYNLTAKKYYKNAGRVRHHIDFNKLNNNPGNIVRIGWGEHWKIHYEHASNQHKNPDYREKIAEGRQKFWADPLNRKRNGDRFRTLNLKNWQDPAYREKMGLFLSEVNKKYIEDRPEKRKELSDRATRTLKRLWQNPYYKNLFHEKIVAANKKRITNNTGKVKFLKICKKILENNRILNKENYGEQRNKLYRYPAATTWETGVKKYLENSPELVTRELNKNHKVVKVEKLDCRENVYDLTIEKSHNFALAAGVFVHNSIDGDNAAAMRYCVTGDTLVVTNKGLLPITDFASGKEEEEEISLEVLSRDRTINKATRWFDSGEHPTVKISTGHGYRIQGSYNHPVLVWTVRADGVPTFRWKLLSELVLGDVAVIDRTPDLLWPERYFTVQPYWPVQDGRREVKQLPRELGEDLAHIIGAFLAEGSIKENELEFCNSDEAWIQEMRTRWARVFPDCRLHCFNRQPNSFGKRPYQTIEVHSRNVVAFLRNVGLSPVKSGDKRVPFSILRSPKSVAAGFLRAYFEGDGSISYSSKMTELSAISKSSVLLDELQVLLLRFGIISARRFDTHRAIHKLYIRGLQNYKRFRDEIGFVSERKTQKLDAAIARLHKDYVATDFIPFVADFARGRLTGTYGEHEFALNHNFDRYGGMAAHHEKIAVLLREDVRDETEILFNRLLENNYLFDPVTSIEAGAVERVYSVKVSSDCHSFVANGFVNHNTECRLSKISEELLTDIEKETVDWIPNYDASTNEPKVLPARLPNLLLNGTVGIAVGMATNIPPHNLTELTDAILHLADNPEAETKELLQFVTGPDFPTGGMIFDRKAISDAYCSGRGPVLMRAKTDIEERKNRQFDIIITEIPYQVNKSELIKHIAELVQSKKIEGIRDVRDESDREGLRVVIELKSDVSPQKILNQLYQHTDLQKYFHFNMIALIDGIRPQLLTLKDILAAYLEYRKKVVRRRAEFNLKKAKERAHILSGLAKALDVIDKVIATIKKSKDRSEAHQNLVKQFRFSDIQANAILEMRLQTLAALERKKIDEELKEKLALIQELELILKSPAKIVNIIKSEVKELKQKYGDQRKTEVVTAGIKTFNEEDLVPEEDTMVTLSAGGYIKRLPPDTFRAQRRGGKGLIGSEVGEEDFITQFFNAKTHDNILFFTDRGRVFQTKVYDIPAASRISKGRAIHNFLELPSEEHVSAVISYADQRRPDAQTRTDADDARTDAEKFQRKSASGQRESAFLIMLTTRGIVKKTTLEDFKNIRRTGIIAISLKKGDSLKWARLSSGSDQLILATKAGQSIRFKESQIRPMSRTAGGIRAIKLKKGDELAGFDIIKTDADRRGLNADQRGQITSNGENNIPRVSALSQRQSALLLVVMANGFAKKTVLKEYKLQNRGGSGIKTANITSKTGPLIAAGIIRDQTEVLALSEKGQVIRTGLSGIRLTGRSAQGVRIMNLKSGDKLAGVIVI